MNSETFHTDVFFIQDDGLLEQCADGLKQRFKDIDGLRNYYLRFHLHAAGKDPDYPRDILVISRRVG